MSDGGADGDGRNRVTLDAVREVFDRGDERGTPRTASEVAEAVGCVRRTAHGKLMTLADAGELETKKVGARARVWWRLPGGGRADEDGEYESRYRSLVQAVEEYAIFRLDADGRVRTWNDGAERITGYAREEVLGEHVSTFYTDADREDGVPERNLAEAAASGAVETEGRRVRADGSAFWASVTITAIRDDDGDLDGYAKVTHDMTDRQERERERRREQHRLDRVFETSQVGIGIFDEDGRVARANRRFGELLGVDGDPEEYTLGDRPLLDADGDPIPFEERPVVRVFATGEPVRDQPIRVDHDDGQVRWLSVNAAPLEADDATGVVVTGADVTQLHEQARRLERSLDELDRELDEVFDRVDDAFYALDADWRFTYVNDRAAELLQRPAAELVGRNVWSAFPRVAEGFLRETYERAMATQETESFERYFEGLDRWVAATVYPSETGLSVYFRDVSDRRARERELERYESIVETIWDGVYAHDAEGRFVMVNDAFCRLTGYDREELLGEPSTLVLDAEADRAATELAESLDAGDGRGATLSFDLQTKDGRSVPAESRFGPYEHGDEIRYTGVVRDVTEGREREARLERQRERLAALNHLHTVAREITDAVIDQSTREEIERVVCERLAGSESYRFAWVAEVDAEENVVVPRVEAGVDGYVDDVSVSIDADRPEGVGPGGRAVRTKELQVSENVFEDPTFAAWRDLAREYGYRAAAAIPVVHDSTFYGLICVYADRDGAFTGEERSVIGGLGEVVGHAIAAVERKRALMSDELVELEFRVGGFFDRYDLDVDLDGPVTIDRTVTVGDEARLAYGTIDRGDADALEALVDAIPAWESASRLGEDGDDLRFEVRLSSLPVTAAVAAHGGTAERFVFEDGDLYGTVHLPPEPSIREVVDDVRAVYPAVELLAHRQRTRSAASADRLVRAPTRDLTDRQQAALEAAYHAGYFEWPRERAGGDVADSLGVTPSTFHQHLRTAERKLLAALYED